MEPTAPNYIERAADNQLFESLLAREYVFLLDSRQKGKSSLVARTIHRLKEKGVKTVKLDLQSFGANVTPEQWYSGLLAEIGLDLDLENELLEYWNSHQSLGPLSRLIGALRKVVLCEVIGPIVIFIDEIDFVRALPFATDEFFAGIRDCYNRRSEGTGFERLTFCIVGVATPGQLIRNPEITPFNIGTRVDLSDFTFEETLPFAKELTTSERNGLPILRRIFYWVNGHPYLTQLLCSHIVSAQGIRTEQGVDRLVGKLFFTPEARHREPNFADIERRMLDPDVPGLSPDERRTQVLDLYGRLLRGKHVKGTEENPVVATLRLSGLGLEERGTLRMRNRTYRTVFDENWRRQSLPDAEQRRQRGAIRLATLRIVGVAGIVVFALSAAAVGIYNVSKQRQEAIFSLAQKTKDLSKTSTDREVALTRLEQVNSNLERTSKERQTALSDLSKSNADLKLTSDQRRVAVLGLEQQTQNMKRANAELNRVSKDREKALITLSERTRELSATSYAGQMSLIQLAMKDQRHMRVAQLVDRTKSSDLRGWEWGHLAMAVNFQQQEFPLPQDSRFERQPDGELCLITKDSIYDVTPTGIRFRRHLAGPSLSPAGRSANLRLGIDSAGLLVFRNSETDRVEASIPRPSRILDVDGASRSILVHSKGKDGMAAIELRSIDGKPSVFFQCPTPGIGFARFLGDGTILSLFFYGEVIRWDRSGRQLSKVRMPSFVTWDVSFYLAISRDASLMCFYDSQYRNLEVRRTSDLSLVAKMAGDPIQVSSCSFSSDASMMAVGGYDGAVRVFKAKTGELVRTLIGHRNKVRTASFLGDGNHIVSSDIDNRMRLWPLDAPSAVKVYDDHTDEVFMANIVDGGRVLLSSNHAGLPSKTLVSRNLRTGLVTRRSDWVGCEFSNSHVFLARSDGTVEKLSANGLITERSVEVFKDIGWLTIYADGNRLLVVSGTAHGEFWPREYAIIDIRSLKVLSRFSLPWPRDTTNQPMYSFDKDGKTLVFSSNVKNEAAASEPFGGIAFLVSGTSGKVVKRLRLTEQFHLSELTPDGKHLVLAVFDPKSRTSRVAILDAITLKEKYRLPPVGSSDIRNFMFDRVGKTLAAKMQDGNVQLWNFTNRKYIATLSPGTEINSLYFSPDGKRILTGGPNQMNTLWDSGTGEELFTLRYNPLRRFEQLGGLPADNPVFSEDGRTIVMACTDGSVRVFSSLPWKDQPKAARK